MTREEFLALDWAEDTRTALKGIMDLGEAKAFTARLDENGSLRARVWHSVPVGCEDPWVYVVKPLSRTAQALLLIDQGQTAYQASKAVNISQAAISRALKRRKGQNTCPCCGQVKKA